MLSLVAGGYGVVLRVEPTLETGHSNITENRIRDDADRVAFSLGGRTAERNPNVTFFVRLASRQNGTCNGQSS